jgi:dTDP-4-amino-4,6-dideoxygalactose transaminase
VTIPITKPVFGDEERRAILGPLDSGWVVQGPRVREFEDRFARFTGAHGCVASSSCTTALHLAVAALGLGVGDEVIVPAFTWVATANVVEYAGATPVFCDIRLSDFNLDVSQLEAIVTPRTVGIIPVHLFGLCADMTAVMAFAERHKLWVVEDAACGFGARINGRHAGTFGDAGCFSFHPRKAITTGEGGMITTGREDIASVTRSLRDHGATRSDRERHGATGAFLLADYPRLGFNYRMTDVQGALGCAQMQRAEWILAERRRVAARYDEGLADVEWLRRPQAEHGFEHGYQAYVCLFAPDQPSLANAAALHERRNALMAALEAQGIATRQGTHAAALVDYYAQRYRLTPEDFPHAWIADRVSLTLPLYPTMTDLEQDTVVEALQRAFAAAVH